MRSRTVVFAALGALVFIGGLLYLLLLETTADPSPHSTRSTQDSVESGDFVPASSGDSLNGDGLDVTSGNAAADNSVNDSPPPDNPLEPAFVIEGRVIDEDGRPIAGADVYVSPFRPTLFTTQALQLFQEMRQPEAPLVGTRTNLTGAFRVELPFAGEYRVETSAEGFTSMMEAPINLSRLEPNTYIVFGLSRGSVVSGVLLDVAGHGLSGETLFLMERIEGGRRAYRTHRTVSRMGGEFRFSGLEPRSYVLMTQPEGRPGRLLTRLVAPVENLEVRLAKEKVLSGVVVDSETQLPIAGAQITALNPTVYDQTLSLDDGRFELLLSGTDVDVVVYHPDYLMPKIERVDLADEDVVIALNRGITVHGRLVNAYGDPQGNALVGVQQGGGLFDDIRSARTDSDGFYSIGPVDPTSQFTLLARLPNWTLPFPTRLNAAALENDQVLVPTRQLEGFVVDASRKGVSSAWIRLVPNSNDDSTERALNWLRYELEGWTDDNGYFRIDDVIPTGGYTLVVRHPERANHRRILESFPEEAVEITLSAGAAIEARLVLPEGEPNAGSPFSSVMVYIEGEGTPPFTETPQRARGGIRVAPRDDGVLYVGQLAPGRAQIHVRSPIFADQDFTIELAEGVTREINIQLRRGHRIVVAVKNAADAIPSTPVQVTLLRQQVFRFNGTTLQPAGYTQRVVTARAYTDAKGETTFDGLENGSYEIQIEGYDDFSREVEFDNETQDQTQVVAVKLP